MMLNVIFDLMEKWLSGLRRTTGNRVNVSSVSRVQIPPFPPKALGMYRVLFY